MTTTGYLRGMLHFQARPFLVLAASYSHCKALQMNFHAIDPGQLPAELQIHLVPMNHGTIVLAPSWNLDVMVIGSVKLLGN